jgi:hypothetical protein
MSLYSIVVFLHIVGALGLFAALGLEWAGIHNLRRVASTGQAREWIRLLGTLRFVGGPSALTLLVTGVYLSATQWGGRAWIGLGLAGLVLIAALGGGLTGRRVGAIARALPAMDGPIPADLGRLLNDPVLILSAWLRTALALGIVFIMSSKPGGAGALTVMGGALVVGLVAGFLAVSGRRRSILMESHPSES